MSLREHFDRSEPHARQVLQEYLAEKKAMNMVISGNNSDRHIRNALIELQSKTMEQIHEIPKNTEGSVTVFQSPIEEHSDEVRKDFHGVVFIPNEM